MQPSKYQAQIIRSVTDHSDNILVQACAGAGKTTTLRLICEAIRQQSRRATILVVAFNKAIATELQRKMPPGVACSTMHSHGFAAIRAAERGVRVEAKKILHVCDKVLSHVSPTKKPVLLTDLRKLVPLVQCTMTDPQHADSIRAMVQRVGINIETDESYTYVPEVIRAMDEMLKFITFDEMITRPITHGYQPAQFDYVLVDETQDLNEAQQELVAMSVKPGGRVVAVGDRFQSIYGFRGADPQAMEAMRGRFHMRELRLPVTYRCPRAIVALAQGVAGESIITAHDNAPEGIVERCEEAQAINTAQDGDMVLCRVNAPLMGHALKLIRQGRKAVVRGRDIGQELSNLVSRLKATDMDSLLEKLRRYTERKIAAEISKDNEAGVQAALDKQDTILAVTENCTTVAEVQLTLENVFSDNVAGVVFSSIHRAKGLESERVIILRPELLPHPAATKSHNPAAALAQERNLEYVAYTRAMRVLIIASK